MKYKRLLSTLLLSLGTLSACQSVSATNEIPGDPLTITNNVDNYHQIIMLTTETNEETTYSATEATLFPNESIGYGSRITKGTAIKPSKVSIYGTEAGAFQQTNDDEWIPSATVDPLLANLAVYPYETFVGMTDVFAQKGVTTETEEGYLISYKGTDSELVGEVSTFLKQFPDNEMRFDVAITLDNETRLIETFHLMMTTGQTVKEINTTFSKYNVNTPKTDWPY